MPAYKWCRKAGLKEDGCKKMQCVIMELRKERGTKRNGKYKKQWHPEFTAALMLELKKIWGGLVFEKEHNLSTKPLEIDLLDIKKDVAATGENEIVELFRGHNLI